MENLASIKEHVLAAYKAGQDINLDHCIYGPVTGSNAKGYLDQTMPYYRLLAGHCLLTDAAIVMEVGTHYGGSTLALLEGMRKGCAKAPVLVTMDVTDLNRERLTAEPEIHKVIGDSTVRGFMGSLVEGMTCKHVDLLYIDALKDAEFVIKTLFNAHAVGVEPTWLILDDVQANESMRNLWSLFEEMEPQMAFLISRDFPHMRRPDMGYGIIYLPGTNDLLGRCIDMIEQLGLRQVGLWKPENTVRLESARHIATQGAYQQRAGDENVTDGGRADLTACYDLARDTYQGRGDIVEVGALVGGTTRALAKGLAHNEFVQSKIARITSCENFTFSVSSQKNSIAGRVPFGTSTLPIVMQNLSHCQSMVNIIDMPTHTLRWCGRPIELLVLGGLRKPQINAHMIAEFLQFMPVGESLILHREYIRPYRPWVSFVFAYLRDHFEIMHYNSGLAVLKYVKSVSKEQILRIVENRFSPEERTALIDQQAEIVSDANLRFDLQLQACVIETNAGNVTAARERADSLTVMLEGVHSTSRSNALKKIRVRIEALAQEPVQPLA